MTEPTPHTSASTGEPHHAVAPAAVILSLSSSPEPGTAAPPGGANDKTPPASPSGRPNSSADFTPMRRGRVHGLDDSPSSGQAVTDRRARAQADMNEKGKVVEKMREGRFRMPAPPKPSAGGDVVRESGIPVWGGHLPSLSKDRPTRPTRDPFELARKQHEQLAALMAQHAPPEERGRGTGLKPLKLVQKSSAVAKGKQKAVEGRTTPSPTHGPSAAAQETTAQGTGDDWQPLTQYLPHQRTQGGQGQHAYSPPPSARRGEDEDLAEALNEAAARRIQDQLWAEELAYNRERKAASHAGVTDPMDEDDFEDDDDEGAEALVSDSDDGADAADGYDSFDEISNVTSVGDEEDKPPLLNIEPALGDDRAKAASRSSIFADTKARVRWSPITCEPIAGMTQAKLVAGIDPTQLRQHVDAAKSINNVFIGIVHTVGGTRSADVDRVTLVTALDTMITLTCRTGTAVHFSAARQDQNGPRLRPGTVLIDTANDDLIALWQESAHWAQAGVRYTVQRYHQPHSAFMVTLEGTRRNRQSVAHGVRAAARKLPQLKAVFKQYNALFPGKGRAARDNLIKSVTARPLTLTSRKALGFSTTQYNIYARLNERDPEAEPSSLSGDDDKDGFPPLTAEMHWAVRDAFQHITIIDGRLGDATPIDNPWDCNLCFAESHPVGKCDLKYVDGWFKTYDEFLAANAPTAKDRADAANNDRKGKAKAPATTKSKTPAKGSSQRPGPARPGPSRPTQPRAGPSNAGPPRAGPSRSGPPRAGPSRRAGGN